MQALSGDFSRGTFLTIFATLESECFFKYLTKARYMGGKPPIPSEIY